MKKKLLLLFLVTVMILSSCVKKTTDTVVEKAIKGNPDLSNISNQGIIYSLDNDLHCVSKVSFDTLNDYSRVGADDGYFRIICLVTDEANQEFGWRKKQLDREPVDNTMELQIIKKNDLYQWDEEDILCKVKGRYDCVKSTKDKLLIRMIFDVDPVPNGMSNEPGDYTMLFYDPDGQLDSMFNFRVFPADEVVKSPEIYKPVIYLYPEEETDVNVTLDFDGEFTCTYPQYDNGWNITAQSDGTLYEADSDRYYNYLFWEGTTDIPDSFDKAIVVSGDETASFLEEYLEAAGLNDSEMDDFITFWLPKMQNNPYNLISFPTEEYEEIAKLNVDPMPDTVIRVYMVYKPLDEYIEIPEEQQLQMPQGVERNGFTVVEWGGSVAE